jgi:hypothetical protein
MYQETLTDNDREKIGGDKAEVYSITQLIASIIAVSSQKEDILKLQKPTEFTQRSDSSLHCSIIVPSNTHPKIKNVLKKRKISVSCG